MARAQYGKLWVYAPDGDTGDLPPGVQELRWSPINGAETWQTALATAQEMVDTLDVSDVRSGGHWKSRAADLLSAVCFVLIIAFDCSVSLVDACLRRAPASGYFGVCATPSHAL